MWYFRKTILVVLGMIAWTKWEDDQPVGRKSTRGGGNGIRTERTDERKRMSN